MPILDLQMRLRQLGRIRTGTKGGKGEPVKLSTFRLTSPAQHLIENAADLYGGEPKEWNSPDGRQWEVITEAAALDVVVPPGTALTQHWEMWSGAGCIRRCDGETELLTDQPCMCPADGEERRTLAAKGQACKPTTRLNLILPRVGDMGVWRLDAHGFNAAVELAAAHEIVNLATSRRLMVPAQLRLEQRSSKRPGQGTRRFVVPVLEMGVTFGELVAAVGPSAMLGGEVPALPEQSRPALGDGAFTGSEAGRATGPSEGEPTEPGRSDLPGTVIGEPASASEHHSDTGDTPGAGVAPSLASEQSGSEDGVDTARVGEGATAPLTSSDSDATEQQTLGPATRKPHEYVVDGSEPCKARSCGWAEEHPVHKVKAA